MYHDASAFTLPPLRSPSMPLQVEDPEQLISRSSPLTGRPRSGSVAHKYPLSPMQLDLPAPLSIARGSPRLSTPVSHESPMSAVVPVPLLRESIVPTYQRPPYHEHTSNVYRRSSPSTFVREMHSPIMQGPSAQFVSHSPHRNSITESFPPNKKRRHSDSPSRMPTMARNEVIEPAKVQTQSPRLVPVESERASQPDLTTIPPPIAATAGPTLMPHRPNLDMGKQPPLQADIQLKDRDSHKVVGALGRRSPPGSAIGRAKAAKEMERNFREATKREPSVSFPPKVASTSSASETFDLKQKEEKRSIATAPPDSISASTKQEDTHEWFLQQFENSSSQSSQQARRSVSLMVNVPNPPSESVAAVSSHDRASPALLENQGEPSSPPRMSEEAVATLEQELEELLTEPDETSENNKMDVDIDRAVTKLVADTLINDHAEEESPQPDKQDPYLTEADVDIELLRLVDDQPAPSAIHDNQSQVQNVEERITSPESKAVVQPPLVDESAVTHDQVVTEPHEHASIQPPAPPSNDVTLKEENLAEAIYVGNKTSKAAASSKKKEAGSKPTKSKVTGSTLKSKSKSSTKSKSKATEGTATPPLVPLKTNKLPIPPPVKKNVSSTAASRSRSTSVMPSGSVEGDNKNVENDEDIDAPTDDDKLYCICKTKYDEGRLMIACDKCDEWYHTQCVNMSDLVVDLVDQFFCPMCIQRNPQSLLKTTYKQRCLNGLKHLNPESSNACHKPALGGGILSKFCSQDCGVKYMEARIDVWVKKGGKRESLWESVKHAENREGVVIRVDGTTDCSAECVVKTEDIRSLVVDQAEATKMSLVSRKWQVKATKSHTEVERLRDILRRVVKMREDIKRGMEVVLWREKLLELAAERAKSVGLCGWDQRLCFGDEEWAEFGVGVLESYDVGGENMNEAGNDMQVDQNGSVEGEWWCPGKTMCDRHAGWQSIRSKDITKEKEQKDEALIKLTTRERELRKRIEDIVDPHGQDAKGTPKKSSLKLSNANGRPNSAYNGDLVRKGKKRKAIMQ
ncbi:hypothetical protein AX14_006878 [Amanita brunnescens Koide BX004]|nr:hypothetical protein AX14_006878 [Amanita brunnescens Koide BX004]